MKERKLSIGRSDRPGFTIPQSTLFMVHLVFSLGLLILVATTSAARLVLLITTASIELVARLSTTCRVLLRGKKLLVIYVVLFLAQYFVVNKINILTKAGVIRELEIRGIPVPIHCKKSYSSDAIRCLNTSLVILVVLRFYDFCSWQVETRVFVMHALVNEGRFLPTCHASQ